MTEARGLWVFGALVALGVLLFLLGPVLTPFAAAAVIAYVLNPLVAQLVAWRLPRALAVALVFALFIAAAIGLLAFLIPLFQRQAASFAVKVPAYIGWLEQVVLPRLQTLFQSEIPIDLEAIKRALISHWLDVGDFMRRAVSGIFKSGADLLGWAMNVILIPVATFYLLLDWERIPARVHAWLPPSTRARARAMALETDAVLGSFLRGQLTVMAALALVYSLGLWLLGLELAFLVGLIAGLVSFVPYLGFLIGVLAAGVTAYIQFQDPMYLIGVALVFGVGQLLESFWLTPKLVGDRIGLHPLVVIFALLAGGQLFGFVGVLIALPAAAALKVWLIHLHEAFAGSKPRAPRRKSAR